MLAEYEGYVYIAKVKNEQVILMTIDRSKCLDGFEAKRDYFKKTITISDASLAAVYELHHKVRYRDCIEKNEIWYIDEGQATGLLSNVEDEEVTINVANSPKDDSWLQYERGYSAKVIKLSNCEEFYIEKKYYKKNDRIVDGVVDSMPVAQSVFKNSIIMHRREKL